MTFRTKLTLTFTVLVAAIIIVLSVIVYFFSARYTKQDFFERMYDRALTAAQVYLEEDELSRSTYLSVLRKYQRNLTDEEIFVYRADHKPVFASDSLDAELQHEIFRTLDKNEFIEFKQADKQWVGILYHDNQGIFYVLVSAFDATGKGKLNNLRNILLICFFGSVVVVWALGWLLSAKVLQPIAAIVRKVQEISVSSLHLRLQESEAKDEIEELKKTFNQMLYRLETSFEMQKNFISNASHELRNPLTAISGEIEVALLRKRTPEEYIASLETLQKETSRLEQLTRDLLGLAQMGFDEAEMLREEVRVDELLVECLQELSRENRACKVKLDLENLPEHSDALLVSGNSSLLKVAIANVLENACKFSDNKEVKVWLRQEKSTIMLTVRDEGIGIPKEELPRIFQTFYRARNARGHRGTGIGLSLTDKIIRMHGGDIYIDSAEMQGTTVTLRFKSKNWQPELLS